MVWSTDTSTAAVEKRAAEQLSDAMAGMVTKGNVEAEQEAAARRAEKEAAAAAKVCTVLGVKGWHCSSSDCCNLLLLGSPRCTIWSACCAAAVMCNAELPLMSYV